MTTVILPSWRKIINESFIPLVKNVDRYLLLYGSRGSSKSDIVAKKLIKRCLKEDYFRYILYRATYNTIHDSQFQNIKDIVNDWGLNELFTFTESPLLIRCVNGNRFLCRGGDDPNKLKSIKDPTGVWYEEDIPSEDDFITITTSIRSGKADYLQEIFTINPIVEGNFRDNWFWQRFFGQQAEDGSWFDKYQDLSFRDETIVKLPAALGRAAREEIFRYTAHHSSWKDNRWLPDSFIAQLLELEKKNPYFFKVYTEGIWANKTTEGNFYKQFDRVRNVGKAKYNPELPIHLTFDFNVHPYITMCIHQVVGKKATQIDEICPASPKNRTNLACREFALKYRGHTGGLIIYGDPAGLQEDTRTEKGENDFFIIQKELSTFRPQMRYQKAAPPVKMRGLFLDDIFYDEVEGITFTIGDNCKKTIAEYENVKEAADGTKSKVKVKDKVAGISFEPWGHISDANDYFLCSCFAGEFIRFQKGHIGTGKAKSANYVSKNSY